MGLTNQDVKKVRGDTWKLSFTVSKAGLLLNMSAATLRWQMNTRKGVEKLTYDSVADPATWDRTDDATGIVILTVPFADTEAIVIDRYEHALEIEIGGEREHVSTGQLEVVREIVE